MELNDNIDRYVGGHLATRWGRLTDDPPIGWFVRKHTEYERVLVTHMFYDINLEHYHHGPDWWDEWDACCDHLRENEAATVAAVAPYVEAVRILCEARYGQYEYPYGLDGSGVEPAIAHMPGVFHAVLGALRAALGKPEHGVEPGPHPAQPTTLYRFYDAKGTLLYVGIAGNPGRRFDQHAKGPGGKPWWSQVVGSTMEHFPDRATAAAAEVRAIVAESPVHNVVHNGVGVRK